MALTAERLKQILHYDPDTGRFTYLTGRERYGCVAGEDAGFVDESDGYLKIKIDGTRYKAHRLAFLYMTGAWPKNLGDHVSRVRTDNRWANLRDVTYSGNALNRGVQGRKEFTKHVGVYWFKPSRKWRAGIRVQGRQLHLGTFSTEDDALTAYQAAKAKHYGMVANG